MPIPMKKGYNFLVQHKKYTSITMPSLDIYEEYYGIGFIVSGDRQISTLGRTFFIHKGFISPMDIHTYHRTTPLSNQTYEKYHVRFTPLMAKRLIRVVGEARFHEIMSHSSYQLPKEYQDEALSIFQKMLEEYEHYDCIAELMLQDLLERLIVILYRYGEIPEAAEIGINTTDDAILNVLSYINIHFADNPSVKELSSIAGLSESHFMKRFRDCTGCSCKTYIHHYKNKIAQSLLTHTKKSIQEISDELGFCNSNYFCKIFKSLNGINPSAFRRIYAQKV